MSLVLALVFVLTVKTNASYTRDTVVFSAQRFHLKEDRSYEGEVNEIAAPLGSIHLYKIRPQQRSHQLTSGSNDDDMPRFSNSDRAVLFIRTNPKTKHNSLMSLRVDGSVPRPLLELPTGETTRFDVSESGQTCGLSYEGKDGTFDKLICIYRHRIVRVFNQIMRFQIVPGSEKIYVQIPRHSKNPEAVDYDEYLLDGSTHRLVKTKGPQDPFWWRSESQSMGLERDKPQLAAVHSFDRLGKEMWSIEAKSNRSITMGPVEILPPYAGRTRQDVILQDRSHISDGEHPSSYLLNMKTGSLKQLFYGEWYDTNEVGSFLSIARKWIGTYKRGNHRIGFLMQTSSTTGQHKQLTQPPLDVMSACWAY